MKAVSADLHRVVYQMRHGDRTEPHTLIASDFGHAPQQAATLAKMKRAPVQLFADGALVAECPADAAIVLADLPPDLAEALASSGLDLVGCRRPDERNREMKSSGLN